MTDKKAKKRLLREMSEKKTSRLEIARYHPVTQELVKTEIYE